MESNKEYFTVTVPVAVGDQFFGWVLGMGNKVSIVDPPEVKEDFCQKMRKALEHYDF